MKVRTGYWFAHPEGAGRKGLCDVGESSVPKGEAVRFGARVELVGISSPLPIRRASEVSPLVPTVTTLTQLGGREGEPVKA